MPQLDFATYASQIFWMAITFAILYFLMARVSLPKVRDVLQHRNDRIASDLKKAESLKKEAETAAHDFTTEVETAKQKAAKIIADAKVKAKEEETIRNHKLDETFTKQQKNSELRINAIKKDAAEKLQPVMVEATKLIVKKLSGTKITDKQVNEALEKAA